jgi:hypothetical protein
MATDKFPQQNVNMPMDPKAVDAARHRLLDPGGPKPSESLPVQPPITGSGGGSRREVRKGEWVDDRVIVIGGPARPSEDSPPEWKKSGRAIPTFVAGKAYQVTLGKPVVMYGRALSPAKAYQMQGDVCLEIMTKDAAAIIDAVELGDVPGEPDVAPSTSKAKQKA